MRSWLKFALLPVLVGLGVWFVLSAESVDAHALDEVCVGGRCSHGPDPAPPGVNPADVDPPEQFTPASFAVCVGDGSSGSRVQVLYVHASEKPNRYDEYLNSIQGWASEGDAVYQASAAETGGMRFIRFVHDVNCVIEVLEVTVSPAGDDDFWSLTGELWNLGFHDVTRKYLVFLDKNHPDFCGQADIFHDDSPGSGNTNNNTYGFAIIYNGCWSSNVTISHELGHNFGAVQTSSPNASLWDHCVDEWDVMCYDDTSGIPMREECHDPKHNQRLDCNHDDYFSTNPPPGSYLATHWNIANSRWLATSGSRIALDKDSSKYKGWVEATLSGFTPNSQITLRWPSLTVIGQVTANGSGAATVSFRTPLAALGTYTILARDTSGKTATDLLRVIPRINLSEFSGYPGSKTRVYLYGFAPGDLVEILWYSEDEETTEVLATIEIAENGRGTAVVTAPYTIEVGDHTIRGDVIDASRSASTTFEVLQTPWRLTLDRTSSKFSGIVGATMTGFAANVAITLTWPDDSVLAQTTTNSGGTAAATFSTPLVPLGDYIVLATDANGTTGVAQLRVIPRIRLTAESGYPGTVIRVYYYGFAPGDQVETQWNSLDGSSYVVLNTLTIAQNGRGTALVTIPEDAPPGSHTVRGDVIGVSRSTSTSFMVIAAPWTITLDKTKSKFNGVVVATMTGFAPNAAITVRWDAGTVLIATTTDGTGNATGHFRTPLAPLGDYRVRVADSTGRNAFSTLRVIPRIKLTEESGPAETEIRVYFYGFAPSDQVDVRWYELDRVAYSVLATVTIAENGRGTKVITIPADAEVGDHIIRGKVVGVSRSTSTTFEVTEPENAEDPTATPTPTPTASPTGTPTSEPTVTPVIDQPSETPTGTPVSTETPRVEIPTESPTVEAPTETPTVEIPSETPTIEVPSDTPIPTESPAPTETAVAAIWRRVD